jgi:hypothetical protein
MSDQDIVIDQPAGMPDPAALMGALGGDPMSLLLSQLGNSNPQAAMMLRVMEERQRARAAEEAEEQQEAAAEAAAERERDFNELRTTVERACAELDVLRERNALLADALGACALCFGADPLCQQCQGLGRPGGRPPDPAGFRNFILPAVRRARAIDARRLQLHPSTEKGRIAS